MELLTHIVRAPVSFLYTGVFIITSMGLSPQALAVDVFDLIEEVESYSPHIKSDQGWENISDRTIPFRIMKGHELLYSGTYSFDHYGRRKTYQREPGKRSRFLVLFGCSFVFGQYIKSHDTLTHFLADLLPTYRVYNYGVNAWGTNQLLSKIQSRDLPGELGETQGTFIYVFIPQHIHRSDGSYLSYRYHGEAPYFFVNKSGHLTRKGSFNSGLPVYIKYFYRFLRMFRILEKFNLNFPREGTGNVLFVCKMISEARKSFALQFPESRFYVLPHPQYRQHYSLLIKCLRENGVAFFDYPEHHDAFSSMLSPDGGHPSGESNKLLARLIIRDLKPEER